MKQIISLFLASSLGVFSITNSFAQEKKVKLYNPSKDAKEQINEALKKAKEEGKHVLLQVGGNWCGWCILLHKFYQSDNQIDSTIKANFILEYVNYSKENRNKEVLKQLGFPQRFGFPVLVILDGKGKRLHTQNTVYLEEGKGYNKKRVLEFLNHWKPEALIPEKYD